MSITEESEEESMTRQENEAKYLLDNQNDMTPAKVVFEEPVSRVLWDGLQSMFAKLRAVD
jgi:hypothetical protein